MKSLTKLFIDEYTKAMDRELELSIAFERATETGRLNGYDANQILIFILNHPLSIRQKQLFADSEIMREISKMIPEKEKMTT